jgi:superfamily II DNA/RNA helicase
VRKPTQLQMYAWEAVFKGYDVVGVAPSNRGKTLSYLVPLVAMLENKELYRQLPRHGIGVSDNQLSQLLILIDCSAAKWSIAMVSSTVSIK